MGGWINTYMVTDSQKLRGEKDEGEIANKVILNRYFYASIYYCIRGMFIW